MKNKKKIDFTKPQITEINQMERQKISNFQPKVE
jgi:hypothetical protein